jgi:hypothetical protein
VRQDGVNTTTGQRTYNVTESPGLPQICNEVRQSSPQRPYTRLLPGVIQLCCPIRRGESSSPVRLEFILRLFALPITLLAFAIGASTACSSPAVAPATADAGTTVDAGNVDAGKVDASRSDSGQTTGGSACAVFPTAADYAALYKPTVGRRPGACTTAQIDAMLTLVGGKNIIAAANTPSCAECMVSRYADAKWAGMVFDQNDKFLFDYGYPSCAEAASKSSACGAKVAKFDGCPDLACKACTDANAFDQCADQVLNSKTAATCRIARSDPSLIGECTPSEVTAFQAACGINAKDAFLYLCGP